MKMIKFVNEDLLLEMKNNKSLLLKEVVSGKKTLQDAFGNDKIIRETNIPADEFQLDMSNEKAETTDVENIIRVHKHMSGLSESQASDERIWVAYAFSVFAEYMRYRWPSDSETTMMNHYFFSYSPKRSLFRHGIARLWWIGHLTYDETREDDKYALTRFVCSKQDHINLLLDINFGNNPDIVKAVIEALMNSDAEGIYIDRDVVRDISEYINTLGGAYLVDALSKKTVYSKTRDMIKKVSTIRKAEKGL